MPDLFGIFQPKGLSPDNISGFDNLQARLEAPLATRASIVSLPNARLGVLPAHSRDLAYCTPTCTPAGGELQQASAWIGEAARHTSTSTSQASHSAASESLPQDPSGIKAPSAGCLIKSDGQQCLLFSDPYGHHPVYYFSDSQRLIFSTKFSPLLAAHFFHWDIDSDALLDFISFEQVLGDRTFARQVRCLPPGAVLSFDPHGLHLKQHHQPFRYEPDSTLSLDDVADKMAEELRASVQENTKHNSKVTLPLSGGLDSRALLGALLETGKPIASYTFGNSDQCPDVHYAKELARQTGIPHQTIDVDGSYLLKWLDYGVHVTGGMMSCNHYHITSLLDSLGTDSEVVLDGLGGDAFTGGHLAWKMALTRKPQIAMEALVAKRATGWHLPDRRSRLFTSDFLANSDYESHAALQSHFDGLGHSPPWVGCHRFDLEERQRRFIQMGPHLLRPRVEVRAPFYAPGLLDFLQRVPLKYLLEQRAYIHMQATHFPSLARIPDAARGLPLSTPQSLRFGKRVADFALRKVSGVLGTAYGSANQSPTDYPNWYRTDLRELVAQVLVEESEVIADIFDRQMLLEIVQEHQDGVSDHSGLIGCILTFANWRKSVR